ncbi:hypothetical protein [uncultured Bacteroides sp.]|uniref:hypothetical protein n=1 Tax=uncultured Bacteroides sp. TaxID=162156 RepID=UPI0025D76513|nr:hypothetical protein [uncultured Bacteroides sp.]
MTLLVLILIAIPVCILTILLWIYNDYRKYKRQHYSLILLFLALPATMQAQYIDKDCCISFKWYENQKGKLEYINENLTYNFIPNEDFWEIVIRNNSSDEARINWSNSQFIINGRASQLLLYPVPESPLTKETIKGNSEISHTCTASILIEDSERGKIYHRKDIRKGNRAAISIVLPISIANKPQFFNTFDFVVTKAY